MSSNSPVKLGIISIIPTEMGPVRRTRHLAVGWSCWTHRSHQLHALHLHFTAKCKGWRSGISGTWHLACHMPCFCNSLVFFHLSWCAWYLLHLGTFGHVDLSFCMVFAIFFGTSTSHLAWICYVLVVQTFMSVSLGIFRVSFRVSLGCLFRVSI